MAVSLSYHPAPVAPPAPPASILEYEQSPYTIGDVTAKRIVWHRAMLKAREYAPKLRVVLAERSDLPNKYLVNSARRPSVWYEVSSPGFVCTCEGGQHGVPCYHIARVAEYLDRAGCLLTCIHCGRREDPHGGHWIHVGGQVDAWVCTSCLAVSA